MLVSVASTVVALFIKRDDPAASRLEPPITAESVKSPGATRRPPRLPPAIEKQIARIADLDYLDGPGHEIKEPEERTSELFAQIAREATPQQIETLLSHPSATVRYYAMKHVSENFPERISVLEPLLEDFGVIGPHGGCSLSLSTIARYTFHKLSEHKTPEVDGILLRAVRSRHHSTRGHALGMLSNRPHMLPHVELLAREALLQCLSDNQDIGRPSWEKPAHPLLEGALRVLSRINPERHRAIFEPFLHHPSLNIQENVHKIFLKFNDNEAASTLWRVHLEEKEKSIPDRAVLAYAKHPRRDETRVESLLRSYPEDAELWLAYASLDRPGLLARWREQARKHPSLYDVSLDVDDFENKENFGAMICDVIEHELKGSSEDYKNRRHNFVRTLGRLGERRCMHHINRALQGTEEDWTIAVYALTDMKDASILPELRAALLNPARVNTAEQVLADFKDQASLPWFEKALQGATDTRRTTLQHYIQKIRQPLSPSFTREREARGSRKTTCNNPLRIAPFHRRRSRSENSLPTWGTRRRAPSNNFRRCSPSRNTALPRTGRTCRPWRGWVPGVCPHAQRPVATQDPGSSLREGVAPPHARVVSRSPPG